MKNKLLILLVLILFAPYSYGAAMLNGEIITNIPDSALVTAIPNEKNTTIINAEDGTHNGLQADFTIQTNGDDSIFDFVLSSTVSTSEGDKDAYFVNNGGLYIMLGNKTRIPTTEAYNDISTGKFLSNSNLIAYAVTNTTAATVNPEYYNGVLSCVIKINGLQDLNISQNILGYPSLNTYAVKEDNSGTYEVVLTLNAIRKP